MCSGHTALSRSYSANGSCKAGMVRHALLLLSLAVLTGCATTATVEESAVAASELYAGEPVALHATEMPVTSAGEARARARDALAERDVDLALYLFVQAVNLDPEDQESLYAIGAIHAERGNNELATRAFARILDLDPAHALANQDLGLALFDARDFVAAEAYLLKAVELNPALWRAHNTLGILADRNEQYDRAISFYSSALQTQPMIASIRNNRGYSSYLSGDLAAAKQDLLVALDIDSEYDRAWRNLGLVFAREQDYERALSAMTRAIPRHVALNDIGYVAMLDGNYNEAHEFFERAMVESPRHYQTAQDNLVELSRRRSPGLLTVR